MKFRLEIELNDDAMRTYGDIRYALRDVRDALLHRDLHNYIPRTIDGESVMDVNGNKVGRWEVIDDTPSPAELPFYTTTPPSQQRPDARTQIGNTPTCEDCGKPQDHCECEDEHGESCECSECDPFNLKKHGLC